MVTAEQLFFRSSSENHCLHTDIMDHIHEYLRALSELRRFLEDHGDRYCSPRLRDFAEEYQSMHDQWG